MKIYQVTIITTLLLLTKVTLGSDDQGAPAQHRRPMVVTAALNSTPLARKLHPIILAYADLFFVTGQPTKEFYCPYQRDWRPKLSYQVWTSYPYTSFKYDEKNHLEITRYYHRNKNQYATPAALTGYIDFTNRSLIVEKPEAIDMGTLLQAVQNIKTRTDELRDTVGTEIIPADGHGCMAELLYDQKSLVVARQNQYPLCHVAEREPGNLELVLAWNPNVPDHVMVPKDPAQLIMVYPISFEPPQTKQSKKQPQPTVRRKRCSGCSIS